MGTTRALAEVQSAESETSILQIDAASGTIIGIDGDPVGAAPLTATVPVSPGEHRVEAQRGASTLANTVRADAGAVTPVSFSVPEEKPAPLPRPRAAAATSR